MLTIVNGKHGQTGAPETRRQRLFYLLFLPVGASANLALGLLVLKDLETDGELRWLQLGIGALCCMIAGWLACATWSKSYWSRSMQRQVATWRAIADAFFGWLEEAPLPAEALQNLKTSLEKVGPPTSAR